MPGSEKGFVLRKRKMWK